MATADRSEAHRTGRRGSRCKRLCATLLAALLPAFTVPPLMAQQAVRTPSSTATGGAAVPAGANSPANGAANPANGGGQQDNNGGKNVLESAGGFTTLELATTTVAQLPSCLEYTIEGITLRVIIHPWGAYYFWTPHVSHYSPDLLEMSHRELQYFPYIEYRLLLAIPYYEFTRTVFSRLLATLLGFNVNVPMAGGHYLHDQFGKHQSVQFSDAMVIGHPVAMLIEAFTFKGVKLPEANGGGGQRPQISQADVKAWLESWVTGDTDWPPVFSQALGYQEVLAMLANSPVIQQIKQLMQQIDAALSSINGKVGDSPFCPVNSTPFEPYYLSGGDVYPWRIGYPVADSEKSLTILNPLSRDVIGPTTKRDKQAEGVIAKVLEKIMEAVRELFRERWGHIYPREGSVDQRDSAKIGAVVAQRAVDLLAEKEKPTGRIYRIPRYRMRGVAWSKMYPVETSCHKNIANTGTEVDRPYDMYAWTVWTQHDCDLFPAGAPVLFVPLGISVTPPVPE
jgi:hypothetical protein